MSEIIQLHVAAKAVLVDDEGRILIVREGATYAEGTQHGKYGLPGGRIAPGESYFDGLRREVTEETGITNIEPLFPIYVGEWYPVIKEVPRHIVAIFMACKVLDGAVTLSDEHDGYEWIDPKDRQEYTIMPPDDAVIDAYASDPRSAQPS